MGIQTKEALIAEIEQFKEEALKTYIVECWARSYTNTDPFGYVIFENENNKVWWMKTQAYQLWQMWQAAKAQAVPEWISVKNAMPKAGSWFVAYDDFNGFVETGKADGHEDPNNVFFSHWLPLPNVPQEPTND